MRPAGRGIERNSRNLTNHLGNINRYFINDLTFLPEDSHKADDVGALGGVRRGHEPYRQQDDRGEDGGDQSPVILE